MDEYVEKLRAGGIGVIPTDTVYGLVGSAFNPEAVERIYAAKGRDTAKPFIILISSFKDLERFGIELSPSITNTLDQLWPGPVTAVLPCSGESMEYLHRGLRSLAFRFPKKQELLSMIKETGPLVAPSANTEGMPPAKNIFQAREYFGETVDFYKNGGSVISEPSTIVKINQDGTIVKIR